MPYPDAIFAVDLQCLKGIWFLGKVIMDKRLVGSLDGLVGQTFLLGLALSAHCSSTNIFKMI